MWGILDEKFKTDGMFGGRVRGLGLMEYRNSLLLR